MKRLNELDYAERKEFVTLINKWLDHYTDDVIRNVAPKFEEILNNEFSMKMLRELKNREEQEKKEQEMTIDMIVDYVAENKEIPDYCLVHNHPLTHSKSYRNVLYDMYIA